jgi:membrane protease YdiL (CAAX protease family)
MVAIALLACVARRHRLSSASFGWHVVRPGDLRWAIAGALVGVLIVYPVAAGINAVLGTPMDQSPLHPSTGPSGYAVQLLFAVVVAPIAEETLFRGLLLTWLRARGRGAFVAAAWSLAAFAAIHLPAFGVGGVVFITLWGVIPSALYLIRGSLTPSWLAHTMNNAWAYLVLAAIR